MMLVKDVGELNAFLGGFSSFYSLWQLCLMQITPFYLAFAVGFSLIQGEKRPLIRFFYLFLTHAGFLLGFSLLFGALGVPGIPFSRYIKYNMGTFRMVAAATIGLTAIFIFLKGLREEGIDKGWTGLPVGLLFGLSLAIAYAPCITPTMSDIMNFSGQPGNRQRGFILLSIYGTGISAAAILVGDILSIAANRFLKNHTARHLAASLMAAVLLLMSAMLVTGWMSTYKSFLVSFFLEQ